MGLSKGVCCLKGEKIELEEVILGSVFAGVEANFYGPTIVLEATGFYKTDFFQENRVQFKVPAGDPYFRSHLIKSPGHPLVCSL